LNKTNYSDDNTLLTYKFKIWKWNSD